jgi:hypothetical protein
MLVSLPPQIRLATMLFYLPSNWYLRRWGYFKCIKIFNYDSQSAGPTLKVSWHKQRVRRHKEHNHWLSRKQNVWNTTFNVPILLSVPVCLSFWTNWTIVTKQCEHYDNWWHLYVLGLSADIRWKKNWKTWKFLRCERYVLHKVLCVLLGRGEMYRFIVYI